jgi:hypothetical protein
MKLRWKISADFSIKRPVTGMEHVLHAWNCLELYFFEARTAPFAGLFLKNCRSWRLILKHKLNVGFSLWKV